MKTQNLTDMLGQDLAYAVLTKKNRLQVLIQPSKRKLRRLIKENGWKFAEAIPLSPDNYLEQNIGQIIERVIAELRSGCSRPIKANPEIALGRSKP